MRVDGFGLSRVLAIAAVMAGLFLFADVSRAEAQSADQVYSPSELTTLPKIASPARVQSLIQRSYPAELRNRGVGGRVQVQFIVGADGKVEPQSVRVVATTTPALADAAAEVAKHLEFSPGIKDGTPVRTQVILPIVYTAN